jgi:type IV pilus assembly protein PilE
MDRRAGFTLIEVLIVMAIFAILGALAYPHFAGALVRTKRTEGQVALIEALQRQERYHSQHNSYLAFSADAEDEEAQGMQWWSGATPASSAYELDAHACPGQTLAACVEIRARPGTERVDARFRDPDCGALTLDSVGRQGAQGTAARCWP